jgi:mannose-6-phosphate isomerase-like protein (cupin superfamily)
MNYTYFLDIDGVLIKHKGDLTTQLQDLKPELLDNVLFFLNALDRSGSKIVLTTGRKESMRSVTEEQLSNLGIFYDQLVMGCNRGARIVVNDLKPQSELKTAFGFNIKRNNFTDQALKVITNPQQEFLWGKLMNIGFHSNYHIKEIHVNPSSRYVRGCDNVKLWFILEGSGVLVNERGEYQIQSNQAIQIEQLNPCEILNNTDMVLKLIEIQTGEQILGTS